MRLAENLNRLSSSRGVIVSMVVAIGIGLSAAVFFWGRDVERQLAITDFERAAADRVAVIERDIELQVAIVESISSLFAGFNEVTRDEFQAFVGLQLRNHPSIQAIEWIPRVPESRRAEFEQAAREDGFVDFEISERGEGGQMGSAAARSEYFPVYYVEPYAGNEAALGFDPGSNPTRLEALEAARDLDQSTATGRINLVQETSPSFGFLIFHPIYAAGDRDTVAARRQAFEGFALGVFRIGDFVEESLSYVDPRGIDFYVYDRSAAPGESFLHFHSLTLHEAGQDDVAVNDIDEEKVRAEAEMV